MTVEAARNTPEELLAALKAGHFCASQGWPIHAIDHANGKFSDYGSPAASVTALGPVSLSVRDHGDALTRVRLPVEKMAGSWCRVVVVDAAGRRA